MGIQLPKYHQDGKEVPVRVQYEEADRESLAELTDSLVPTSGGGTLPVSAVTDTQFLPASGTIIRRNKRMGRTITLELDEGEEEETRDRVMAILDGIDLPEGISFTGDVQRQGFNDGMANMWLALGISIVLIYLLMGFLFESFVLPLSIVFTIPLSIIGVYWAHFLTGMDIDMLGMVAMILLVGVVVNNGIVLIDYVNRLRSRGRERSNAVLAATNRRFRPIMMTAITTIGGLIPLAFTGSNAMGFSYKSFAMTLIGGMTTATLLTLLVVPVLYSLFDDARGACSAALGRALGRRPPGSRPAETEPTTA
jgi:HAE1 family hydrophobic/amphiphilic exporter-1